MSSRLPPAPMEITPRGHLTDGQESRRANAQPYIDESAEFRELLIQKRREAITVAEGAYIEQVAHQTQADARAARIERLAEIIDSCNNALAIYGEKNVIPNYSVQQTINGKLESQDQEQIQEQEHENELHDEIEHRNLTGGNSSGV